MKHKPLLSLSLSILILLTAVAGVPVQGSTPPISTQVESTLGAAFTYQGRLTDGGSPANGAYDLRFILYDAASGGSQVGVIADRNDVVVTDGIFTVSLDFGSNVFTSEARWLEIGVRSGNSTGVFTTLSPRQALTATPYALYTLSAWALTGNGGTDPNTDFLGTTDSQPLIIKTGGAEAARVDPNGKIGIGTTNPNTMLHINGTGLDNDGSTAVVRIVSGNGAQNLLLDGNEIDATADGLFLNNNTTENVILVNGGGNVGIGTTNPTGSKLYVKSAAQSPGIYSVNNLDIGAAVGIKGENTGGGAGVVGESKTGIGVLAITDSGDIFVGRSPGAFTRVRIDQNGKGFFNGGTQTGGADFAWSIPTTDDPNSLEPGDVLIIDPENPYRVKKSQEENSRLVAGVYSTKPSVLSVGDHGIDDSLDGEVPVGVVGVVPTKVSAENGPILIGDLLVTSSTPGHAMKAQPVTIDGVEIFPAGSILGKALEPLETGTGVIDILVTLQ